MNYPHECGSLLLASASTLYPRGEYSFGFDDRNIGHHDKVPVHTQTCRMCNVEPIAQSLPTVTIVEPDINSGGRVATVSLCLGCCPGPKMDYISGHRVPSDQYA
jgi:hypothetical protein